MNGVENQDLPGLLFNCLIVRSDPRQIHIIRKIEGLNIRSLKNCEKIEGFSLVLRVGAHMPGECPTLPHVSISRTDPFNGMRTGSGKGGSSGGPVGGKVLSSFFGVWRSGMPSWFCPGDPDNRRRSGGWNSSFDEPPCNRRDTANPCARHCEDRRQKRSGNADIGSGKVAGEAWTSESIAGANNTQAPAPPPDLPDTSRRKTENALRSLL